MTPKRSTRRDFFKALKPGAAGDVPADDGRRTCLIHVSRKAMACQFEALFNAGQYEDVSTPGLAALDLIAALEEQLSCFRVTGEIARLNALASEGPVPVEPRLFDLLRIALDLYRETGGAVDITSAPLWETWGFSRRQGKIPDDEQLAAARAKVGGRHLELDAEQRTVRFKIPGLRLNLGSIGKGYALDRAAETLAAAGIHDYLFHGGWSSILARGSRLEFSPSGGKPSHGWTVGVNHPLRPDRPLAEIRLRDRAVGTSAGTFQYFRHRGRRYGHILDPRSGRPADCLLSVTVAAPTATLADGLSTAFFVMGLEETMEFCRTRPGLSVLLVAPATNPRQCRIETVGFSADELSLATR